MTEKGFNLFDECAARPDAGLAVSGVRLHANMPTHTIFCLALRSSHA